MEQRGRHLSHDYDAPIYSYDEGYKLFDPQNPTNPTQGLNPVEGEKRRNDCMKKYVRPIKNPVRKGSPSVAVVIVGGIRRQWEPFTTPLKAACRTAA